jgi:alkane 1-monooxygenase
MDHFIARAPKNAENQEFPAADPLSILLVIGHFIVLITVTGSILNPEQSLLETMGLFIATGLFLGQVSNSNAHALILRQSRLLRALGTSVYTSLLFGHHTSAHRLVHHVHVATDRDPNSARWGENYYRFAARAWIGSFRAGLTAENKRMSTANKPRIQHPYIIYVGGAALALLIAITFAGPKGAVFFIALCGFAQSQLLISDYVQHYGLRRKIMENGKPEPVSDRHSWNAPHWFSSSLMLNAPRHSDHHAHPMRPYPALRLTDQMPQLPRSLPVMATVALWPKFWKKVMDPRVRQVNEI